MAAPLGLLDEDEEIEIALIAEDQQILLAPLRRPRQFFPRINNEFLGRHEKVQQRFRLTEETVVFLVDRLTLRLQQEEARNHALTVRQSVSDKSNDLID